ncbi:hypothetical protein NNJEOMEG_02492 [Fundidesulfovibrio magnetotacticus]|uniref:Glycosyltransferase n=1 Tax=Fundidesulfovibrio magnetotacticus TaxID=2730080 RepID=A0A6V8M2H5_9BACT|nr:hypothetical protein [Fundidesulfovibrio magnetotacticus]GFK94645.1 hypothetical protein NNJEOMEG_02492 [Fundidesulfovibrio magnetotacticus]
MSAAFEAYTRAVLSFRLGAGSGGYATAPAGPQALEPVLRRARGALCCALLGVGSGAFARDLARALPEGTQFVVLETDPDQTLAHGSGLPLLADASPVALAWMLLTCGLTRPGTFLVLNPEIADEGARERLRTVQRLHAAFEPLDLPDLPQASTPPSRAVVGGRSLPGPDAPGEGSRQGASQDAPGRDPAGGRGLRRAPAPLTLAAILHPDEPDLADFFSALPSCADRAVFLWDAQAAPGSPPPCPVPALHLAHPLQDDFAAQRNRLLEACGPGWTLSLDADERLTPGLTALLPALTAQGTCRSFAFERRTLCPQGVRVGWGLWPDLQVRLFVNGPGVRYVRPVHERLEGLDGPTGLVLGAGIRHLSGLLKDEALLAAKHALFDRAGGRGALHRLNREYPALPEAYFAALREGPAAGLWPGRVAFAPL